MVSVGFERGARKKKTRSVFVVSVFYLENHERKEKKNSPPPRSLSRKRASFFTAPRALRTSRTNSPEGQKERPKRFLPFPIAFREEKIPGSLSYTRRSFFFSPWEKKTSEGENKQKKPKEHTRTLIPSARVILRVRVRTQQIGQVVHASQQSIVDVRNFEV